MTGSSWVAAGLTPGGRYEFKLQSVNGLVRGGFSHVAGVTAGGVTPGGPTDLRATPGTNQATLSWTPVAGASGYYVYQRTVSTGESGFTQLQYPVTGSSWVAAGLTPGGRYEVKLQSINGYIRGGFSNVAGVTAGGITPAGPANLRATAGDRAVTLTWTPAANASGYSVYVRNATAGEPNLVKLPYPVSGSSWTVRGLIAGAVYQFQLRSLNGHLGGGYSNVASSIAGGFVPHGPTDLRAVRDVYSITLLWTPAANTTGYFIYMRDVTAGETGFRQLPYPVTGVSWTVGGLRPGHNYEFYLQSLNYLIYGDFSRTLSVQLWLLQTSVLHICNLRGPEEPYSDTAVS